jgi:ABC-type Na+ efflux pump permease subunit
MEKALIVFRKDWLEIRRNSQVLLPIIVVPLMLAVILPVLLFVIPTLSNVSGNIPGGLESMVKNLPSSIRDEIAGMTSQQTILYIISLYFFAPFFMIIPLMASSVTASDSFAGEKERKTIEALLATPISDSELLFGKILVSFIPSMMVTIGSFIVYSTVVDVLSYTIFNGRLLLPNLLWIILVFGLAPTVALAGIGLTVMISSRVRGFREAQQISVVLLLPILTLVFGQAVGAIIFGPLVVAALIGIFGIVDIVVFYMSLRIFRREEILLKLAQ